MPSHRSCLSLALLLAAAPLTGCSQAYFWSINTGSRDSRGETVSYAPGSAQQLDVYRTQAHGPAPVVVFFYGGSWRNGQRQDYRFVAKALTERGIVVVIPDYRKAPRYRFPVFMHDAASAFSWTRAKIAGYGGDPTRIFVMGHSAGGQIAALLATDAEYLQAVGMRPRDLAGVIGLAGPYDFLPIVDPKIKAVFGAEKDWPRSQPVNFVDGDEPPFLLIHGASDTTVRPTNSQHLAAKLQGQREPVVLKIVPATGHIGLLSGFASPRFSPVLEDSVDWINATDSRGAH
jgi:acetyl esterase/lipase